MTEMAGGFRFGGTRIYLGLLVLVIGCAAIVVVSHQPPARVSGSFLKGAQVDPEVRAILERSCRDCHSDDTRYPWYSFLPGVSRVIQDDVARGREQLNFSRWTEYSRLRRQRALTGVANQVRDRAMPLSEYVALHPSTRLSDAEIDAVFKWAQAERLRLILEGQPAQDVVK
jgi:hypothetical protein